MGLTGRTLWSAFLAIALVLVRLPDTSQADDNDNEVIKQNRVDEVKVEQKLGPSDADKVQVGPRLTRPEHLRVGRHTMTVEPIAVRELFEEYRGQGSVSGPLGVCITDQRPGAVANPEMSKVGYEHTSGSCTSGAIYQTAVKFDFPELREFLNTEGSGALEVIDAELKWENEPGIHRADDGGPGSNQTCVGRFGLLFPGPAYDIATIQGLIPDYTLYEGVIYLSQEVDNLRVNRMIRTPSDNNGFLFGGSDEDRFTRDNAACVSIVSNFKLTFLYEVFY